MTQVSQTTRASTPLTAATRPRVRNTTVVRLISFTQGSQVVPSCSTIDPSHLARHSAQLSSAHGLGHDQQTTAGAGAGNQLQPQILIRHQGEPDLLQQANRH